MKRIIQLVLLIASLDSFAQFNPSFETADAGWETVQGKFSRHTVKLFNGTLPFTPSNGNYFVSLENDTLSSPRKAGMIRNSFAFIDTPASLYFDGLYLPVTQPQHARFTLYLSRWNGTQRDSILYYSDTIGARFSGPGQIALQWTTYAYNLNAFYKQKLLPDTAMLTFTNDDVITSTGTAVLHLDNILLRSFPVGLLQSNADHRKLSIYPNPAKEGFTISWGKHDKASEIAIFNLAGERMLNKNIQGEYSIYLDPSLEAGLYLVRITYENGDTQNSKFFISR